MPRLLGITIPDKKNIDIALTYLYGIGANSARAILKQAALDPFKKAGTLKPEELNRLKEIIEKSYKIEGELKREIAGNIKRLKEIGSWRGVRHMKGLPVRGQRTKTNTRTVRGNVRKTVGSGRKPAATPT
jgi:small subunit ribosomal protein S13